MSSTWPDRIVVTVTAEDIRCGRRCNDEFCPIARALKRTMKRKDLRVSGCTAAVGFDLPYWERVTYNLSQKAVRFVDKFDEKGKSAVKPATFILSR